MENKEITEEAFFRKCAYRNCKKEISGRPNKKFCNRKCKSAESIYVLRKKKFIDKYKEKALKDINILKLLKGTDKN